MYKIESLITKIIAFSILTISINVSAQTYQVIPNSCLEDIDTPLSEEIQKARSIWMALTGTTVPMCDDRLKRMEIYIKKGDFSKAVDVALKDPLHYNIRVRDMAARICSRDVTFRTEVNDCIATIVGIARDGLDVADVVTGNFFYRIDLDKLSPTKRPSVNRNSLVNDILRSNRHYEQINDHQLSMYHVLKKEDGQQIIDLLDQSRARPAIDPAGVITSRAFMEAHATAGTNRRMVQMSFEQFLCKPITDWADNTVSDRFVGRDVDRKPGNDPQKYHITCKGCHAPMDSMRGAFARVDFNNNFYRYSLTSIQDKMNRNGDTNPDLFFVVSDDSYDSQAIYGANSSQFGWRGYTKGSGMSDLAQMIAESRAYNSCWAKHAFQSACGRAPQTDEEMAVVNSLGASFDGLNQRPLSYLYKKLALNRICLGVDL